MQPPRVSLRLVVVEAAFGTVGLAFALRMVHALKGTIGVTAWHARVVARLALSLRNSLPAAALLSACARLILVASSVLPASRLGTAAVTLLPAAVLPALLVSPAVVTTSMMAPPAAEPAAAAFARLQVRHLSLE